MHLFGPAIHQFTVVKGFAVMPPHVAHVLQSAFVRVSTDSKEFNPSGSVFKAFDGLDILGARTPASRFGPGHAFAGSYRLCE
jgi:hypothetical protein